MSSPWYVKEISFDTTEDDDKQLDIHIDFERGAKFKDSTGAVCSIHDTVDRGWQHLDFFQHRYVLHARVPRIRTSSGEVKQIDVPWARPGSGFTLYLKRSPCA